MSPFILGFFLGCLIYMLYVLGTTGYAAIQNRKGPKAIESTFDSHKTKMLEIENSGRAWWELFGTKCECKDCKADDYWIEYQANRNDWSLDERWKFVNKNLTTYEPMFGLMHVFVPAQLEYYELAGLIKERDAIQKAKEITDYREKERAELKSRQRPETKHGYQYFRPSIVPDNAFVDIEIHTKYGHTDWARAVFTWIDVRTGKMNTINTPANKPFRAEYYELYSDQYEKPVKSGYVDYAVNDYKKILRDIEHPDPFGYEYTKCNYCENWALDKMGSTPVCSACKTGINRRKANSGYQYGDLGPN